MGQDAAASLAAANKRIGNILKKSEEGFSAKIETDRFELAEEEDLFNEVMRLNQEIEPLMKRRVGLTGW